MRPGILGPVIALVPVREGSRGIPLKNIKPLSGRSPMNRAMDVCRDAFREGWLNQYYVCSDIDWASNERGFRPDGGYRIGEWLYQPAPLHTDTCSMLDVVKDALGRIAGPENEIVVLVQPSQPLRTAAHLRAAVQLLEQSHADSVVSVVPLPATHHPQWQARILGGRLEHGWTAAATRRQDLPPVYIRDGTVYAFRRWTVSQYGDLYGHDCRALVIPAAETCPLDTPEDWAEAERRLCAG